MKKNREENAGGVLSRDETRQIVRDRYSKVAVSNGSCCGSSTCCSPGPVSGISEKLGYSKKELSGVPEGSDMGLGCGNPQAIAGLKPGETVVDLGCGGGFDCFLAAGQVGEKGSVIGVDMTPEMISKARANAFKAGCQNVEFRLGEIEHLPVADKTADVIISNCVINLSPDKPQVFADAFRVLKEGGRLAISDIVAIRELPSDMKQDHEAYCGCAAGATLVSDIERMLRESGFADIVITVSEGSREFIKDWFPGTGFENYVRSAIIMATKRP
jgi:SAM-dependent methyltransferase